MEDSLDRRYAKAVLLNLYKLGGTAKKVDLVSSTSGWNALTQLLVELKNDGYIDISEHILGRRTYEIKITDKGRAVARKFKEAEEVAESPAVQEAEGIIHFDGEDIDIQLTPEEQEKSKYLKFLFHFNVMDNHITVEEAVPGKSKRIFNIYLKQNCHGDFRLWCEQDNSYDCWHVKEAWGYPQVQQMMMHYTGKTKICPVCSHENRENANFCENCGAKLE